MKRLLAIIKHWFPVHVPSGLHVQDANRRPGPGTVYSEKYTHLYSI